MVLFRRIERHKPAPGNRGFIELNPFPEFRDLDFHIAGFAGAAGHSGDPAVCDIPAVGKLSETDFNIVAVVTGQQCIVQRIKCSLKPAAAVKLAAAFLLHETRVADQPGEIEVCAVIQQIDGCLDVIRSAPIRDHPVFGTIQEERQRAPAAPIVRIPPEFKVPAFPARIIGFLGDDRIFGSKGNTSGEEYCGEDFFDHGVRFQGKNGRGVRRQHVRPAGAGETYRPHRRPTARFRYASHMTS